METHKVKWIAQGHLSLITYSENISLPSKYAWFSKLVRAHLLAFSILGSNLMYLHAMFDADSLGLGLNSITELECSVTQNKRRISPDNISLVVGDGSYYIIACSAKSCLSQASEITVSGFYPYSHNTRVCKCLSEGFSKRFIIHTSVPQVSLAAIHLFFYLHISGIRPCSLHGWMMEEC